VSEQDLYRDLRRIWNLRTEFNGPKVIKDLDDQIADNYQRLKEMDRAGSSSENWRWYANSDYDRAKNRSPETIVEREIIGLTQALGTWANQVPVNSGISEGNNQPSHIDLVHRTTERTFELIELKIDSKDPYEAALQILRYGLTYRLFRRVPTLLRSKAAFAHKEAIRGEPYSFARAGSSRILPAGECRDHRACIARGVRAPAERRGLEDGFRLSPVSGLVPAQVVRINRDKTDTGTRSCRSRTVAPGLVAELAGAADRPQTKQVDMRREVVFAHRLIVHERGAQVFLIVVAEDGDDGGVWRDFVLGAQSGEEVAARRDPHSQAKIKGELLRHEDGIAIGDGDDLVEILELDDLGHEFVGDALDAVVTDFAAGG